MIPAAFFQRDPIICARELIGTELIWGRCAGRVVETEAYLAQNDEASHTFSRPSTRAFVERNKAGAAYIYFSYGAHWMLNVLVKGKMNGFVLFRAVQPTQGIKLMKKRRDLDEERGLCSGPGKLTQAFGITDRYQEMDLCSDPRHCFAFSLTTGADLSRRRQAKADVVADARIGITRSAHHPWRFTLRDSEFVSRKPKR
ncbi:MAG TPA: DNA-3-methyladenine glycosylase [Chthoniobacterales bacterium]|nr:DNA-3-methyladenine glycosylase [Chthoniobacterales bacterium]